MSCSSVIDYYTTSKYLYRGPNRYKQSYTCGCCDGCNRKSRTDWRVRTYYECEECLSRSSYNFILFDTLTYCDKHIKRYSDIFPELSIPGLLDKYCFSRDDVQKFFKRLRESLRRDGYDVDTGDKDNPSGLRYILSSEYGTSEKTRGFINTHRPHYHILFFVNFKIEPVVMSRYISQAWPLGKTDGVRPYDNCEECYLREYCKGRCLYQSPVYVMNERLVSGNSRKNCMKAVNYVTKYISKDLYLGNVQQIQIDTLFRYFSPSFMDDYPLYKLYRRFCGRVLPFHLQSRYFGYSLIRDGYDDTCKVLLPTGKKDVVREVALPRYYQRHLYYNYKKEDGRVRWFLNQRGIDTKLSRLDDSISSFMREYRAYDNKISSSKLFDLALYSKVYRGTFTDYQSLLLPYKDYYRKMIIPHFDEMPLYYNYNTKRDAMTIGRFLSTRYVIDEHGEILFKGVQEHSHFIPFDGYVVVTDKVCPYWRGFDSLLAGYDHWRRNISSANDAVQYERDKNQDYHRSIGMK